MLLKFLKENGGKEEKVILDPGIGFGKRPIDNLCIIKRLNEFKSLKKPLLVGASRKSFIGAVTGEDNPKERLGGSLAAAALAVERGADILRVHDVKETKQLIEIFFAVKEAVC